MNSNSSSAELEINFDASSDSDYSDSSENGDNVLIWNTKVYIERVTIYY